jgi:ABC-type glycerol-3-phosphate transport system permease component
VCAGATIQVLPILFLTFFVQKYIIDGPTLGSVN